MNIWNFAHIFFVLIIHRALPTNVDRMQMYDQIFDGRIYRAHNTAISSIIAKAIEEKEKASIKPDANVAGEIFVTPKEVHLSLAPDGLSYVVTWSTQESTKDKGSHVEYGKDPKSMFSRSSANETKFIAPGNQKLTQYFHRAIIGPNLEPNVVYYYRVGNDITLSTLFFCTAFDGTAVWSPHIALYGDMGNVNAKSIPRLQRETQAGMYDMIIHVGDLAYNMASDNGRVGNEFMEQIEPIAAYVPYMTCPGNHEWFDDINMTTYKAHFSMPEERSNDHVTSNLFFSFDVGPIHFISVSTEYLYNNSLVVKSALIQHQWLIKDLERANLVETRSFRPWIILYGHRPMYCSTLKDTDHMCDEETNPIKNGVPQLGIPGLEKLLWKYNVDVAIWAHEHNYERLWPVYDGKVLNGSRDEPYTNPKAPVHITTGSAGCQESFDPFINTKKPYDAFRSTDYGYTRLKAFNRTHLKFSQVSDDQNGAVVDEVWIIKTDPRKTFEELNMNLP